MTRPLCMVVGLLGCGAPRRSAGPEANATAPASASPSVANDCAWRPYFAPAGCYVDDSFDGPLTIADEDSLARILRILPPDPHVRHPPCDPATEAAAFDFARHRVFICKVPGDHPQTAEPIRVECGEGSTRVVVRSQAAAQCGHGDEVGTSVMMLVLPAGIAPVERLEEGRCDQPGGDPPS